MYFIFHDGIHTKTQYVRNRHCSCHGCRSEARKRDKCAFLHTSFKTKKCANVVCTFVFDVYTTIEWHHGTSIVSVNVNFSAYFFVCVCFFFLHPTSSFYKTNLESCINEKLYFLLDIRTQNTIFKCRGLCPSSALDIRKQFD